MRRAFTLLLAVLLTGSMIYGQTKNDGNARDSKVIQELRKLVQAWDHADVTGDKAALDRLLADEFSFVGGQSKAQYLASLKSKPADLTIESAVSTDVQCKSMAAPRSSPAWTQSPGKTRANRIQTAGSTWTYGLKDQAAGSA